MASSNTLNKEFTTDFLARKSLNVFMRFNVFIEFLKVDLIEWRNSINSRTIYQSWKNILNSLQVVNDNAGKGVELMEEFNEKFTKNDHQKQYLLRVGEVKIWIKTVLLIVLIIFYSIFCYRLLKNTKKYIQLKQNIRRQQNVNLYMWLK